MATAASVSARALAEGLRRDAEAVRTYDPMLGTNPGDPIARRLPHLISTRVLGRKDRRGATRTRDVIRDPERDEGDQVAGGDAQCGRVLMR